MFLVIAGVPHSKGNHFVLWHVNVFNVLPYFNVFIFPPFIFHGALAKSAGCALKSLTIQDREVAILVTTEIPNKAHGIYQRCTCPQKDQHCCGSLL